MSMTILDAVHEIARGWHEAGDLSDEKMREYDFLCGRPPGSTVPIKPKEPDREGVSSVLEGMSIVRVLDDYNYNKGKADMFKRVLWHRFGDLPKWVDTRLDEASVRDLDQWSDRVFTAKSLEAVFL